MRLFFVSILTLFFLESNSQDRNSVWIFGDSAGIDFSNTSNPVPITSGMRGRGSCASISDSLGNLILYSFTVESAGAQSTQIHNHSNLPIAGADSITGMAWYQELVLIPKPGAQNMFNLFSIGMEPNINQGLFLTEVDMNLNGGLGMVTQQNVQLDTNVFGDCLTAVKHGNGRDWWVIGKYHPFPFTFLNRFFIYLVTPDSVSYFSTQDFNDASDVAFQKIIWHPFLSKFMLINVRGYMSEFSFDRCSGVISLDRTIYPETTSPDRIFFDGAYSPSGNIFYISRNANGNAGQYNSLLQYDLLAANIPSSCDTIDSTMYPGADGGSIRLAPDGKIYYSQAYPYGFPYQDTMRNIVNENLGVINLPDSLGATCDFQPFSFYLGGKRTYYGLPNNPNYDLPALAGSICDTLSVRVCEESIAEERLNVFYRSGYQTAMINASGLKGKSYSLSVVDILGRKVFSAEGSIGAKIFSKDLNCFSLANGVFIVILETEKEILDKKFVKE